MILYVEEQEKVKWCNVKKLTTDPLSICVVKSVVQNSTDLNGDELDSYHDTYRRQDVRKKSPVAWKNSEHEQ